MLCPNGHAVKQLIIETRSHGLFVYRKRYCCACELRYTTKEAYHPGPVLRDRK
jgi:transcriptional regulator NrdR family protein